MKSLFYQVPFISFNLKDTFASSTVFTSSPAVSGIDKNRYINPPWYRGVDFFFLILLHPFDRGIFFLALLLFDPWHDLVLTDYFPGIFFPFCNLSNMQLPPFSPKAPFLFAILRSDSS